MSTTTLRLDTSSSGIRTFHHSEFSLDQLLEAKGATTVSVCLPARNEARTVGSIVSTLRADLLDTGAIDEIVVLDDHSTDDTARVAADAGARVADAAAVLPEFGGGHGKGEVLWKSLHVTEGDIVLWCDSDISEFGSRFVSGLLGPLLCEPGVDFAKGYYRRPERERAGMARLPGCAARCGSGLSRRQRIAASAPRAYCRVDTADIWNLGYQCSRPLGGRAGLGQRRAGRFFDEDLSLRIVVGRNEAGRQQRDQHQ